MVSSPFICGVISFIRLYCYRFFLTRFCCCCCSVKSVFEDEWLQQFCKLGIKLNIDILSIVHTAAETFISPCFLRKMITANRKKRIEFCRKLHSMCGIFANWIFMCLVNFYIRKCMKNGWKYRHWKKDSSSNAHHNEKNENATDEVKKDIKKWRFHLAQPISWLQSYDLTKYIPRIVWIALKLFKLKRNAS